MVVLRCIAKNTHEYSILDAAPSSIVTVGRRSAGLQSLHTLVGGFDKAMAEDEGV